MSRYVDLRKPLSDDDREYLESRARIGDILANDRQFADLTPAQTRKATAEADADAKAQAEEDAEVAEAEEVASQWSQDALAKVLPLKVAELKDSLSKFGLSTSGDKSDLQVRLLNHYDGVDGQA